MNFSTLSNYFAKLESVDSRLQMTEILAQLFNQSDTNEIDKICYLSLGILSPKFVGLNLMLAEKMMIRAVATALNLPISQIKTDYKNSGDLGISFFNLSQKSQSLNNQNMSIVAVYKELVAIANQAGAGSQERKISGFSSLLKNFDSLSGKYLVRFAVAKLRLGFSDMTILDALSWSQKNDKSLRPLLEDAYNARADIGQIAKIFKSQGLEAIKKINPEISTPIVLSRATPLLDPKQILAKMNGQAILEPKFDGFRVQLHFDRHQPVNQNSEISLFESVQNQSLVKIYSRNLDDITFMFPELITDIAKLPVDSVILDGEALAFDPTTGQLLDFQETIKRKRKHDIDKVSSQIPLQAQVFDILYLNGRSLIKTPFIDRRKKLNQIFSDFNSPHYLICDQKIVNNPEDFDAYFRQLAGAGLEGLMAKKLDAPYKAGKRDFTWVKYKVGMQSQMADTVDAVVIGYFKGKGKWTQFGLGKILVGIPDDDKIYALSKVGSGLSEDIIKQIYDKCQPLKIDKKPNRYVVDKTLIPDVWVKPEIIVEIRADSISSSSLYQTGLSLRFPRFIRFREDKNLNSATTLKQLKNF